MPRDDRQPTFDVHPRPWRTMQVDSLSGGGGAWSRLIDATGGTVASAPTETAHTIAAEINRAAAQLLDGTIELSAELAREQHALALDRAEAARSETSRAAAMEQAARWEMVAQLLDGLDRARVRWASVSGAR